MRLFKFLLKQFNDIKKKGITELLKKIKIFFTFVLISPLFIPALIIVFLVRIVSSFITIRFSPLSFSRIGELNSLVWYLKLKKAGEFKFQRSIDLFFINIKFNKQWLKLWKRSLTILSPSLFWKQFYFLNKLFGESEKYEIPILDFIFQYPIRTRNNTTWANNIKEESLKKMTEIKDSFIYFKKKEIEIGKNYLRKMGTSEYNFICFSARDSTYLNQFDNTRDWNYHNFRDCNIFNYLPSMKEISKKNFYCFRMGSAVINKLEHINSRIIDYANSEDQSDFLDIYLGSRCFFSVYSNSGITMIPETFNRPIAYVNWPDITDLQNCNNSLFIPKKYYSTKDQRFLTFKEIIELILEHYATVRTSEKNKQIILTLNELNIVLVENTPQEINEIVLEIYSRLNGTWKSNKEEERLQQKFWLLFDSTYVKSPTFRIGSDFLKKNQSLLD